ncbi:single-stranded DNA-binding protein [Immundisolibacter sp.]
MTQHCDPVAALSVVVDGEDGDTPTWCTVLAFEELAALVSDLRKGGEVYAKGRLSAALYTPPGGEPRVSLTLLASHARPLKREIEPLLMAGCLPCRQLGVTTSTTSHAREARMLAGAASLAAAIDRCLARVDRSKFPTQTLYGAVHIFFNVLKWLI